MQDWVRRRLREERALAERTSRRIDEITRSNSHRGHWWLWFRLLREGITVVPFPWWLKGYVELVRRETGGGVAVPPPAGPVFPLIGAVACACFVAPLFWPGVPGGLEGFTLGSSLAVFIALRSARPGPLSRGTGLFVSVAAGLGAALYVVVLERAAARVIFGSPRLAPAAGWIAELLETLVAGLVAGLVARRTVRHLALLARTEALDHVVDVASFVRDLGLAAAAGAVLMRFFGWRWGLAGALLVGTTLGLRGGLGVVLSLVAGLPSALVAWGASVVPLPWWAAPMIAFAVAPLCAIGFGAVNSFAALACVAFVPAPVAPWWLRPLGVLAFAILLLSLLFEEWKALSSIVSMPIEDETGPDDIVPLNPS